LPLYVWLLVWLLPIPPFWFVLRTIWPKNADPNGMMGILTLVCLGLYIPTIIAIFKPIEDISQPDAKKSTDANSAAETINFDVDFNVSEPGLDTKADGLSTPTDAGNKQQKSKSKPKRKRR